MNRLKLEDFEVNTEQPSEKHLNETFLNDSFEHIYKTNRDVLGKDISSISVSSSSFKNNMSESNTTTFQNSPAVEKNPRKDHYSYSYSYKTADPDSGMPGVSTVEVNESVTEEIGPDGSKIIRRHQQEKQVNKITQVVTQRVIKRQYIDPNTGQVIEYDPKNELFANLPPETVFEEHTVIADEASQPPVVSTSCVSKTTPPPKWQGLNKEMANLAISENDYVDNLSKYSSVVKQSFKIKSHPEDNQGYPEEKNMDYDPDDINCYPDDDLPYEGLLPVNKNLRRHARGSGSASTSSSSPVLFDSNQDMPVVSSYQKTSQHKSRQLSGADLSLANANYATVMPITPRQQQQQTNYGYLQQHNIYSSNQQFNSKYQTEQSIYGSTQQATLLAKQQSPSLNHPNEYGKTFFLFLTYF